MYRLILLIALLALAGFVFAQDAAEPAASPEPAPAIPVLVYRSYDQSWLRFYNDGLLTAEEGTLFDFRWLISPAPVYAEPDNLAELIALAEAAAESAMSGSCDPRKLQRYNSSDLFCSPGTLAMPVGSIILAIYSADAEPSLLALTTSIDNRAGGAAQLSLRPAATAEPTSAGCGPYVPGQWIKPQDYAARGQGLPVVDGGGGITDYQCIVPSDGGAPYLQAYRLDQASSQASVSQSGSGERCLEYGWGTFWYDRSADGGGRGQERRWGCLVWGKVCYGYDSLGRCDTCPEEHKICTAGSVTILETPEPCPTQLGCDGDDNNE